MEVWFSHSTDLLLLGIFVTLLFISGNITTMVRELKKRPPLPTAEQLESMVEQVNYVKWHVDQIRQHIKYGVSEEEAELKNDAEWLKSFKNSE